jgi:hypothetical protein
MAIDFPASPALNQQFSAAGSIWVWDGTAWNIVPQMTDAVASDTPPANPADGQFWWRASTGQLYLWYNDGNTKQWVQAAGAAVSPGIWEPAGVFDFTAMSSSSPVVVNNLGAFRDLRLTWDMQGPAGALGVQFSADNGATFFQSSSTDYVYADQYFTQLPSNNIGGGAANANIMFMGPGPGGSPYVSSGSYKITRFNKAAYKGGHGIFHGNYTGAGNVLDQVGCLCLQAVACNALRFVQLSVGPNSGRLIVEGVRG